jgi:hypothetical protein
MSRIFGQNKNGQEACLGRLHLLNYWEIFSKNIQTVSPLMVKDCGSLTGKFIPTGDFAKSFTKLKAILLSFQEASGKKGATSRLTYSLPTEASNPASIIFVALSGIRLTLIAGKNLGGSQTTETYLSIISTSF